MDITSELNRVLKYSADGDTLKSLLHPLHDPNSDEAQPNSHHRLVTADALQESGRESEAHLLRSPHRIYMWQGKVHHARGAIGDQNRFRRGYQDAAFFSSTDHDRSEPLDENFGLGDLTPETMKEMYEDAVHFYHSHADHIPAGEEETAGHNFWYSRNGHGTGFFDHEDQFGEHTDALGETADKAGEYYLNVDRPEEGEEGETKISGYGTRSGWGQPPGLHETP